MPAPSWSAEYSCGLKRELEKAGYKQRKGRKEAQNKTILLMSCVSHLLPTSLRFASTNIKLHHDRELAQAQPALTPSLQL